MKSVPIARFQKVDVEPFTQEEIESMLKACTYSREAETLMRREFTMRRPTANRDQAILLTLLDSGIRASEFSALRVDDFEAKRGKLETDTVSNVGQKAAKGGLCTWGKQPDMPFGDTLRNERMAKNPMCRCSVSAGIVLST